MISIKNIAEKCGVSIATVSKALNDHKDVGAETKEMVLRTAKEMGYIPNTQARALKTNRTYNVGVLLDDVAKNGLTHAFFSAVIDNFRVEMANHGYDVTLINIVNSQVGTDKVNCYEHCKYRNFDGVLATCVDFYSNEIRELLDSEIPVVSVDFKRDGCYSISSDNAGGIKQIVEYVYECGHQKIAYIYGDSSQVTTTRLNAYLDTMKELGLQVHPDYLRQARYVDGELTEKLMEDMLKLQDPPTCVILPDDIAAIGAMNAVRKLGKSIPDDISIVGYDGINMVQLIKPSIATYCQDAAGIGRAAGEKLLKLIRKEDIEDFNSIVPGHLIEGNTVKNI